MSLPLPAGWTRVPVVSSYATLDESDLEASKRYVVFVSSSGVVKIDGVVVVPRKITARVEADGTLEAGFSLPSTNDPDLSTTGWGYTVIEKFAGGRAPFPISVPYDADEVDLATVNDEEPDPVTVDGYLRQSDIGESVASQEDVEAAQSTADDAATAAAGAQSTADTHSARTDNPHGVTAAQVGAIATSARGAADGVCDLDGDGKVPIARLPAIAISEVFVVNSEAAQLALDADEGDFAVRTDPDPHETYIHNGGTSGTMADWTWISLPDAAAILAAHVAAANPHAQYVLATLIGAASGVAPLNADAKIAASYLAKKRVTATPASGALVIDLSLGADFAIALSANVTSTTVSNGPPAGYAREGTLIFVQDATGGRTWTPPVGAKWPNGLAAVLTSAANAVDHIGYRVYNNGGTLEYTFYPVRDVR